MRRATLFLLGGGLWIWGCTPRSVDDLPTEQAAEMSIEDVLERYTADWMAVPGVVGTGIGLCEGTPCIKVFVSELTTEVRRSIPETVDGYEVRIEVTGEFHAEDPSG